MMLLFHKIINTRLAFGLIVFMGLPCMVLWSGIVFAAPKFPPPPGSKIGLIAESMVFNGVEMDVRQFNSKRSVEEVLEFYREFWPKGTEKQPGYTETDALEPWQLITRVEGGYLMTVQVTAAGRRGSTGLLGMSRLPDPENLPKLGKNIPKMSGSRVFNDIKTKDIGKNGRTVALLNDFTVENNANFYRDYYSGHGFGLDMDKTVSGGDSHALRFSKRGQVVTIVINKTAEGTVVVIQTES
ncbi:MAG: hypothetical protein IIA77_07300 [Proteobacteria bacterium]|nr:hypothetical protein [Pseudomonadota bacterium]